MLCACWRTVRCCCCTRDSGKNKVFRPWLPIAHGHMWLRVTAPEPFTLSACVFSSSYVLSGCRRGCCCRCVVRGDLAASAQVRGPCDVASTSSAAPGERWGRRSWAPRGLRRPTVSCRLSAGATVVPLALGSAYRLVPQHVALREARGGRVSLDAAVLR